jgi:hypothetical protein
MDSGAIPTYLLTEGETPIERGQLNQKMYGTPGIPLSEDQEQSLKTLVANALNEISLNEQGQHILNFVAKAIKDNLPFGIVLTNAARRGCSKGTIYLNVWDLVCTTDTENRGPFLFGVGPLAHGNAKLESEAVVESTLELSPFSALVFHELCRFCRVHFVGRGKSLRTRMGNRTRGGFREA